MREDIGTEVADTASRRQWITPVGFAVAFCLVGLITLDSYGPTWDEPMHRAWGEANWNFLRTGDVSFVTKLPGGGEHYGPLFYLLGFGVSQLLHEVIGIEFTAANHVLTLLVASVGVACTFLLAERIVGRRAAVAASTLLILLPSFNAHAQYNPKDIPLLTLITATLLFAVMAYRSHRKVHAVSAGALFGLAVALKPSALIMVPILGAALLVDLLPSRRAALRAVLGLVPIAIVASLVSLFASWPMLWRQPHRLLDSVAYFARGSFWTGDVLYFGQTVPATDLPWHYTPVMLLLTLPLVMPCLAVVGAASLMSRAREATLRFPVALLLFWSLVPVLLFMKPGLARYDGMRQLFFIIPAIAILVGAGWDALRRLAFRRPATRWVFVGASAMFVAWLLVENVRVFPYGGSYVNAPARATFGPHLEHQFEIEYWGASYREGLRWLSQEAAPNSSVCVPLAEQLLDWQSQLIRPDLVRSCENPSYIMLITRFSQWPEEYSHLKNTEPLFSVRRFGAVLLRIHRVEPA